MTCQAAIVITLEKEDQANVWRMTVSGEERNKKSNFRDHQSSTSRNQQE